MDKKKRFAQEHKEAGCSSSTPPNKKFAPSKTSIIPSKVLEGDENYLEKLKKAWLNKEDYSDSNVSLNSEPFQHGESRQFLENEDFLEELVEKFDTFEFHEKTSDLFQFRQSDDLKSYEDPHIYKIREYLTDKMLPWLKAVTGLPLNGNIDLFLSDYRKHDFLLCHDDELESRRIAFILYLSKNWKSEFGGNLDLFSATKDIHPDTVVKSITPEFNKFAFFSVDATSFHQVSEVTEDEVKRLALSGWFYGDPVQRPKIEFPKDEAYLMRDHIISCPDVVARACSEGYLDEATLQDINEQVSEESQILIPGFLKDSFYQAICKDIVEQDATFGKFVKVGPPNVACYQEMCNGPPPKIIDEASATTSSASSSKTLLPKSVQGLCQFFHSNEFLELMEKITELPFTTSKVLKATTSLRKYTRGSYSLLRSGGAKQTGDSREKDHKNHKEEKSCNNKKENLANDDNVGEEEEEESDEDPNLVDIFYFVASKWDESWGGLTIYNTDDGEQLITISPEGNCLAIVVRNSSVNSCVNFINSGAGEELFFVYSMTCALDGNL